MAKATNNALAKLSCKPNAIKLVLIAEQKDSSTLPKT
mgnify:FL=1